MPEYKTNVPISGREYDITVGDGFLAKGSLAGLADIVDGRQFLVVSDSNVSPLYGTAAANMLLAEGAKFGVHVDFTAGEPSKTLATVNGFYTECVENGMDRKSLIVALGGGVTGDMAGFLAATYMRGLDYIQIPTSLLAQVDSSVGGKTGVDLPEGKNLVGAFKQPRAVLIDVATLQTLPPRELRCGLAEVVKYGVIMDAGFFSYLEAHVPALLDTDPEVYTTVVKRCCELKAEIVLADEEDLLGKRAILNYGHTFGHALEKLAGFTDLNHGEAVAIGMMMAAELAMIRSGDKMRELLDRQEALWTALGLPTRSSGQDPKAILDAMKTDKKYEQGKSRVILPEYLGKCVLVKDVPEEQILTAIEARCDA